MSQFFFLETFGERALAGFIPHLPEMHIVHLFLDGICFFLFSFYNVSFFKTSLFYFFYFYYFEKIILTNQMLKNYINLGMPLLLVLSLKLYL